MVCLMSYFNDYKVISRSFTNAIMVKGSQKETSTRRNPRVDPQIMETNIEGGGHGKLSMGTICRSADGGWLGA